MIVATIPEGMRLPPVLNVEFFATVDAQSIRPFMPDNVPYLLPCSSWARSWEPSLKTPIPAPLLPPQVSRVAADCGGFVATLKWGEYRYLSHQYVTWCHDIGPALEWAAIMDYCCEPEIALDRRAIRERQNLTSLHVERFYQQYADVPWAWVPTIQGWDVDDYRAHARALAPVIFSMQRHYRTREDLLWDEASGHGSDASPEPELLRRVRLSADAFRVGIGTLCRRASIDEIRRVVLAVADELPGIPLHLWGVKLGALQQRLPAAVTSVDSAAWNGRFGSYLERQKGSGLTQREFSFKIALPEYLGKVDAALGQARPEASPSAPWLRGQRQRTTTRGAA